MFKNLLQFYKRYWLIVLLAFIATSLLLIKIFLINDEEESPVTPSTQTETYKGIVPGKTTVNDLQNILGAPNPKQSNFSANTFAYDRPGGGPPDEVVVDNNQTVSLVKEKILSGNLSDYIQKHGNPEGEFYGEHKETGFKNYVWAQKGLNVIASANDGTIFEVWYFKPTSIEDFLKTWGASLTKEYTNSESY